VSRHLGLWSFSKINEMAGKDGAPGVLKVACDRDERQTAKNGSGKNCGEPSPATRKDIARQVTRQAVTCSKIYMNSFFF